MKTRSLHAIALALGVLLASTAQAALFEDDEARRAILDLRQRMDRQGEEIQQFQRSLIEQQNQFEALRAFARRKRRVDARVASSKRHLARRG